MIPGLGPVVLIGGRCVGGSTTINTKVALRATQRELDKWHAATGLCNERGEPISCADLDPYYDRVERYLGVRDRATDWDLKRCVQTAKRGFEAVGATLEPVRPYADENCGQCGSCLQGCPTNSGKSTMNTYIQRNVLVAARWRCARTRSSQRMLIEDRGDGPEATGVEYVDARRSHASGSTPTSSWSRAGSLSTPLVLHALGGAQPERSAGISACTRRSSCSACSTSPRTPTWSRRSPATATTSPPTRTAASRSRR